MAQEITTTTTQVQTTVVQGPALPDKKVRTKSLVANPPAYVAHAIEAIKGHVDNYDNVVRASQDRMVDTETKNKAAQEYLELIAMQDYIAHRLDEIKGTVFNTLDERDLDETEGLPEWADEAPKNVVPGEIHVEDVGIKFQRSGGAPKGATVDEKSLAKAHPRIYKNFVKKQVIPATEEQIVEVFDVDAFLERAKRDSKLREFIKNSHGTVSFRVYNIFDED